MSISSRIKSFLKTEEKEEKKDLELPRNVKNEIPLENILKSENKTNITRRVLHERPGSIIFMNSICELEWELRSVPDHALIALREFVMLNGLINFHLNRVQKNKLSPLLASRFHYCLTANEHCDTEVIYADIKEYVNKAKGSIKRAIETPKFAVYLNSKYEVVWWYYQDIPEYMRGALDELESLKGLASTILPSSYKSRYMNKLASALANAFNKNDPDLAKKCFKDARNYLSSKAISFLKLKLFLISVIFSALSFLTITALYYISPELITYQMGVGAGIIGAMVSSLQRKEDISIDNYAGENSLYCESLSRLIIGATFGCFLVFGTQSELFLAPFKNNLQAIVCFCFISGFVERFVPDLINGVVRRNE